MFLPKLAKLSQLKYAGSLSCVTNILSEAGLTVLAATYLNNIDVPRLINILNQINLIYSR